MEGENLTGDDTDRGYDLRSRGPPTFDNKALDSLVFWNDNKGLLLFITNTIKFLKLSDYVQGSSLLL